MRALPAALIVLAAVLGVMVSAFSSAHAVPPLADLSAALPGVPGPLNALKSCTVAVDSNPDGGTDLVQCSGSQGYAEIFCENRSTTSVFYGGATDDIDSVGPCISTDTATCKRDAFRFSVRPGQLGADTASGTATLYCTEGR